MRAFEPVVAVAVAGLPFYGSSDAAGHQGHQAISCCHYFAFHASAFSRPCFTSCCGFATHASSPHMRTPSNWKNITRVARLLCVARFVAFTSCFMHLRRCLPVLVFNYVSFLHLAFAQRSVVTRAPFQLLHCVHTYATAEKAALVSHLCLSWFPPHRTLGTLHRAPVYAAAEEAAPPTYVHLALFQRINSHCWTLESPTAVQTRKAGYHTRRFIAVGVLHSGHSVSL